MTGIEQHDARCRRVHAYGHAGDGAYLEVIREQRKQGFEVAMKDMTGNLTTELERFRDRIKSESVASVTQRNGGAAATGAYLLALLVTLLIARRTRSA